MNTIPSVRLHPAAYGCALYIFVAVARLPEIIPQLANLYLGKVAVLLALGGLLVERRAAPVFSTPIGKRILAFSVIAVLSVGFSVWGSHSLEFLVGPFWVIVIMFYLVARTADSIKMLRFYILCLIFAASLLSYLTVQLDWQGRLAVSASYDANDLAMVLVTILPLAVARAQLANLRGKLLFGGVAAIILLAIMLTESRGGFLGLLGVTAYLLFRKPTDDRKTWSRLKAILIVCAAGTFIWFAAPQSSWDRIATLTRIDQDYNVTERTAGVRTGRIGIWQRGLKLMITRPVGVGLDAFPAAEWKVGGRHRAAHNSLIQVGAELGAIGLLIFLSFYLTALRLLSMTLHNLSGGNVNSKQPHNAFELSAYVVALRAALLGFFLTSFFLSQAYSVLFYMLLGLITAMYTMQGKATAVNRVIPSEELVDKQ